MTGALGSLSRPRLRAHFLPANRGGMYSGPWRARTEDIEMSVGSGTLGVEMAGQINKLNITHMYTINIQ